MGSAGRRRPSRRRRPPSEPTRRPPFGAPRQPWWGTQEWWPDRPAQHRLIGEPAKYGFLDEPAQPRFLSEPAPPRFPDQPAQQRPPGEPAQYGFPGEPAQYGFPDETAQYEFPDETAQYEFPGQPAQRRRPDEPAQRPWFNAAPWRRWFNAAARHPWYTGLGAGAGFMMLASGVIFILPKSPSAMMTQCGMVHCTSLRATSAGGGMASPNATRSMTGGSSRPAKPAPAASTFPAAVPSAMGSAAPQIPPPVTVTYALIVRWHGGLMGEFTIANHGSTVVTGWELAAAFPGDQIQATWGPVDPNVGGYTVVMEAQPDWPTIAPGASQSGYFIARGNTAAPSNCTFNGAACTRFTDSGQAG